MHKVLRVTWVIVLDVVGIALIILAILIGWLPGPGGIPLALVGLSLLAINHTWAERLLQRIKAEGLKLKDKLFKKKKT